MGSPAERPAPSPERSPSTLARLAVSFLCTPRTVLAGGDARRPNLGVGLGTVAAHTTHAANTETPLECQCHEGIGVSANVLINGM